jgi:Fur family ferric uptake transcriptional regulator
MGLADPMRATRQRALVAEALGTDEVFRSAQSLFEVIRASGEHIGLTTVYRTLQAMAENGEVDVIRTGDGESVYRRCASDRHHHHLVCRSCGTTVELPADDVEAWTAKVAKRHGFADVTHTVEVFGVCATCRR